MNKAKYVVEIFDDESQEWDYHGESLDYKEAKRMLDYVISRNAGGKDIEYRILKIDETCEILRGVTNYERDEELDRALTNAMHAAYAKAVCP